MIYLQKYNLLHNYFFFICSKHFLSIFFASGIQRPKCSNQSINTVSMESQSSSSEYLISLQYLLHSYGNFVVSLRDYLTLRVPVRALHSLLHIWNHPRGIYNLIRTLALQHAAHSQEDSRSPSFVERELSTLPVIPAPNMASTIEVANPRHGNECGQVKLQERECEQDEDSAEEQRSGQSMSERSYKRGPYKSYSQQEKERAVRLLLEQELPVTEISRKLHIPCKNIKRWSTQGVSRKSGGGRKRSSPKMEQDIKKWILQQFAEGEIVELDRIREYALAISGDETFKASRGWVCKFIDRAELRGYYTFR